MPETIYCRHCEEPVSEIVDPWGGRHGWIHNPDDGIDAHVYCECHCFDCDPKNGYAQETTCIDGEMAEPTLVGEGA